jgi:monoamine oxidase
LIRYSSKITEIRQASDGVTVTYTDHETGDTDLKATADWCVCTIPLSILSQIPMNVGAPMASAIRAVPYASSVKVGLQFRRRFWEEDEQIYGGITSTDLPISTIGYPNCNFQSRGKGVLLGTYAFGINAMDFTAMTPKERVAQALSFGSQIHPQYPTEYENGIAVAWHRSPFTLGCFGLWTPATREQHYDNLCAIDGRIVLAGDHASYFNAWQEGAVTSALDAISRLHARAVAQGAKS